MSLQFVIVFWTQEYTNKHVTEIQARPPVKYKSPDVKLLQRWRVSSFIWTESTDICITHVNEGQESQSKSRLLHISSSSNIHTVSGRRGKVGADGYFLNMQLAHDHRGDMSLRGSDQQEVNAHCTLY